MPRFVLIAIAILLLPGASGAAKRSKPVPCAAARYLVVEGGPLIGGAAGSPVDAIVVAPKRISIAGGCVAKASMRASRKFTGIHARWKSCPPLKKITLTARIAAPQCSEMQGTVKAKKTKAHRFRALQSTCGDGRFDPGGEACDAGQGCASAERCDAACTCMRPSGGPPEGPPAGPTNGVVELPPGSTLSLATLQVVARNATAIGADGSFSFESSGTDPTLVLISDGDGVPVLGAYSDSRQSGPLRVNARSTALALLFFASGAFTRSPADFQQVRDVLAAHPAFALLAAAIEQRLGAEPHAIALGDAGLLAAIGAAIDSMSRPPAALRGTTSAAPSGNVVSRLLADPQAAQSGVIVSDSDDQTGLQITNTKRRHLLFYVTQTGFKDEQNQRQPLDRPVVSGQYLSSTNKLAGVIGSGIDVFVGNGAYQPSHSDPLPLPVLPLTAKEAYYHVTVVGPGINQARLPALGLEPFKTGATQMLAVSFLKDLFVPFLVAGLDVHLNLDGLADPDKLNKLFMGARGLLTLGGPVVHVGLGLSDPSNIEFKELMHSIFKAIADDPAFRQKFINWFTDLMASLAPDAAQALTESALNGLVTKINFWLALIDKAMSLGDAVVAANDMRNAHWFEEWDVTAIPVPVRLTPAVATVTKGAPAVTLTTSVTGLPNQRFVYRYSTTGTHGLVCPIVGDCATTADSTFDSVQYIADVLGVVEGDLDTVTVEVFYDDGSGVVSPGAVAIGKAVSRIVGEATCAGPQVEVVVPSAELRSILHQRLGVAAEQPLTCADLERLTMLGITQRGIETLEGLQFAINLTALTCNQCVLRDIGQVSRLRKLTSLSLTENGIVDVTPVAGLVALTSLDLQFNRITDVRALAGLTNLTLLNLRGNVLDGIDALAGLTRLQQLFLRETRITSATALTQLVDVENLTLSFNQLTTLDGLQGMTKLARLEIDDNGTISDLGALTNLQALVFLDAEYNSIEDIAPLAGKTALTTLDLSENYIADLHVVDWGALPLGHLDLRSNLITDITPLAALSVVGDLDLSYNRISNAAPLTGLHALSALAIRNNLLTSLKPLVDNSGIGTGDTLNIQQNCLSESDPDIKTLKDRGVQMYYQPQGCGP